MIKQKNICSVDSITNLNSLFLLAIRFKAEVINFRISCLFSSASDKAKFMISCFDGSLEMITDAAAILTVSS